MAKDPAFLFYSSDFLTGVMFMNHEQIGKYVLLLCAQHQTGHLNEKDMLNICGSHDEKIWSKFTQDSDGKFYNIRCEEEINKRKNYSLSRSTNRKSTSKKKKHMKNISKTYVKHMENENEIENVIKTITINEVYAYFETNGYKKEAAEKFYNYYSIADWKDSKGNKVKNWKQKAQSVWFKPENKIADPNKPKMVH